MSPKGALLALVDGPVCAEALSRKSHADHPCTQIRDQILDILGNFRDFSVVEGFRGVG